MSYAATMGARQQRFAGVAVIGGRQQGFAGFGSNPPNTAADAAAAFTELDSYGGGQVAASAGAQTPLTTGNATPVPMGASTVQMSTSSSDQPTVDFNSWFPGFANQVIQAGTTIAVDAIGSKAPTYVPVPVAPPEQTIFGIPVSLLLLGGGAFLLLSR